MLREGPSLSSLLHRMSECPPVFLEEPRVGPRGRIYTAAIVGDLIRAYEGNPELSVNVDSWLLLNVKQRARLRLVQIACWLLADGEIIRFVGKSEDIYRLLQSGLDELAEIVDAEKFVTDEERREEFIRYCLSFLNLRPAGESIKQAEDRLATLNSVEQQRIMRDTAQAQRRAEQIRQALKQKAAQEAAAKVTRE